VHELSFDLTHFLSEFTQHCSLGTILKGNGAPCGLWGCKNRPASFPVRMLYKATKQGSVCSLS